MWGSFVFQGMRANFEKKKRAGECKSTPAEEMGWVWLACSEDEGARGAIIPGKSVGEKASHSFVSQGMRGSAGSDVIRAGKRGEKVVKKKKTPERAVGARRWGGGLVAGRDQVAMGK